MLTAVECLAKAEEMEAHALKCVDPASAADFIEMAACWRRNAVIARHQEVWVGLHPDHGSHRV